MTKKLLIITIVLLIVGCGIYCFIQNKQDTLSKYSNCELGDLVGDDVERILYKEFYIDYHREDFIKSQAEDFAKECIAEGVKNQYQMDCCIRTKMYPDD